MKDFDYETNKIVAAYHESLRRIEFKEERLRREHQKNEEALERIRMIFADIESQAFYALGSDSSLYGQLRSGFDESFYIWQNASEDVENSFQAAQRQLRQAEEDAHTIFVKALRALEAKERASRDY